MTRKTKIHLILRILTGHASTEAEANAKQLKLRLESESKTADRESQRARELAKKLANTQRDFARAMREKDEHVRREVLATEERIVFGMPSTDDFPFVLDCATSVNQRGKIEKYAREGKKTPKGCVISKTGEELTDSKEILQAFIARTAAFHV